MINLINGDCLEEMDKLIKDGVKVDLTVTSPPYFNLRKYTNGNKLEIGTENNVEDYVNNLKEVFSRVYNLTNKKGSCYVNISDKYNKKGSLIGVPDMFKLMMIDIGWICKNEIIWHKPNAMPCSAKNRYTNDFEKVFFFVKSKKYIFNTQYEERITKPHANKKRKTKADSKYLNLEQEASVRQGMNKSRGSKIIEKRNNLPSQKEFVDFMRKNTSIKILAENSTILETKIAHWFRYDESGFAYPTVEDWNSIKNLVNDWSNEFSDINFRLTDVDYETDDINKNSDKGRLKRTVWTIPTKASKLKHFAPYPEKLIITPILASSNINGIVFDPFMGSGTTGKVAIENDRGFIGIEIENNFFNISKKRLIKA